MKPTPWSYWLEGWLWTFWMKVHMTLCCCCCCCYWSSPSLDCWHSFGKFHSSYSVLSLLKFTTIFITLIFFPHGHAVTTRKIMKPYWWMLHQKELFWRVKPPTTTSCHKKSESIESPKTTTEICKQVCNTMTQQRIDIFHTFICP